MKTKDRPAANVDAERILRRDGWLDAEVYGVSSEGDTSVALFVDRYRGGEVLMRAFIKGGEKTGKLISVAEGWSV